MSKPKVGIDENGWVRTGPALNISGVNIAEKKEFDGELPAEPRDPNKNERAVHYNGGNPELRETGNPQPPTVEERIEKIEKGVGVGGQEKQGIAQRIDELEQRVSDLENSS